MKIFILSKFLIYVYSFPLVDFRHKDKKENLILYCGHAWSVISMKMLSKFSKIAFKITIFCYLYWNASVFDTSLNLAIL